MIDKIIRYLYLCFRNVPTSTIVGLLLFFCIGTVLLFSLLGKQRGLKWTTRLLFLEYLCLLLILAVLTRKVQGERLFDFSLFWSYRSVRKIGYRLLLLQIVANVTMFIPIGILLGCIMREIKWWKVLLIGGGFSLLIESFQFFFKRGFAEFDDVFHNVLGCMIGYGIYKVTVRVVKMVRKRRAVDVG